MEHIKFDLGHVEGGSTVVVTLLNQANVRLLDASNYRAYSSDQQYRFYGGRAVRSPLAIRVPHSGTWVLALDLGGHRGRIEASVAVRPPESWAS